MGSCRAGQFLPATLRPAPVGRPFGPAPAVRPVRPGTSRSARHQPFGPVGQFLPATLRPVKQKVAASSPPLSGCHFWGGRGPRTVPNQPRAVDFLPRSGSELTATFWLPLFGSLPPLPATFGPAGPARRPGPWPNRAVPASRPSTGRVWRGGPPPMVRLRKVGARSYTQSGKRRKCIKDFSHFRQGRQKWEASHQGCLPLLGKGQGGERDMIGRGARRWAASGAAPGSRSGPGRWPPDGPTSVPGRSRWPLDGPTSALGRCCCPPNRSTTSAVRLTNSLPTGVFLLGQVLVDPF